MSQRNLFVTTALPYANGAFHMGHIMEYIQADIWVRHERMSGNKVHFVGADDVHGAPIMIAAQKRGITPQAFVAEIAAGRKQYLDGFHISFDNWHSTDAVENHELSQDIYRRLVAAGLIYTKEIEQYYDTVKGMFLADRFIKGTCPRCGATDQYGDNCEKCSAVYSPDGCREPVLHAFGLPSGNPQVHALLLQALRPAVRPVPPRLDQRQRQGRPAARAAGGPRQGQRMARQGRQPLRLGHLPRRTVLRHRHSRRSGQVLLRLA